MRLIEYVDRVYIIHLPERTDRYKALKGELRNIGIDIHHPKVQFPKPPYPTEANGFPSLGVYSNFIRHLGILKECLKDGIERVWVLEDDAIFRHQLRDEKEQQKLIQRLRQDDWDLCFLGHKIEPEILRTFPPGLVRFSGGFTHMHCYCVNAQVLPKLVHYFEETLINPPGHPRGGRLYIDAAFNMFRELHPEVTALVSNPNLSTQKGCLSNIASRHWYDRYSMINPLTATARSLRDEAWRYQWI
ncbi:MAG: hypothetical protein NW224_05465 [Leptolyngbyaceae cyanobacterium bins.302]|nr:hypothetical protein [Leptolyngbyaceae cyanobacterium bins.302]